MPTIPRPRHPMHPDGQVGRALILRQLLLTVNHRLDGLLHGDHRGLVPGHGSEAGEARPYVAGDDVRRIDWNVSARSMEPHVRDTVADRELECWLVVDTSASMHFGTARSTKAALALQAAGAFGFLTARSANRVGGVFGGVDGPVIVPARQGRHHVMSLLDQVMQSPRDREEGLAPVLDLVANPPRRRGLVVVISDFLDTAEGSDGWVPRLRALGARHDVVAVEVVDPRELELPDVGVLRMVDPESGEELETTTSARTRARYAAAARDQRDGIRRALRSTGADHVTLRTDGDWVLDIVRWLDRRRRSGR